MVVFRDSPFSTSSFIKLIMTPNVLSTRGVATCVESFSLPASCQELLVLPVSSQVSLLSMQAINHY